MSDEPKRLRSVTIQGFRSISDARVPLSNLTVLVGPNGSGKTNVLNVLRLPSATIRFDLPTAVDTFGGFGHIIRNDGKTDRVRIEIEALVTAKATDSAPDKYTLEVSQDAAGSLQRNEEFTFKRMSGAGRRITVNGSTVSFGPATGRGARQLELADAQTSGLSTLPRLAQGGEGIDAFANFISSIRVIEPVVDAARQPARLYGGELAEDASNLADALWRVREMNVEAFTDIKRDLGRCLGSEALR